MGISYIRPSGPPGPGVYSTWSAWAADGARAPGDVGIQDEASIQTDAIVLPALAGLEMLFVADVTIQHATMSPLVVPTGCTGLVIAADAGHLLTLSQTGGGVVPAMTYGTGSGFSATRIRCEGTSTAVQGPAVSTGAVRCSHVVAVATGTAWSCARMEDVVFEDVTLRGDGVALRCNTWAGRMERVVLRGAYPWAPCAYQCGWCGDAEMRSVDLRCTDIGGGICAWNVDRSTIAVGTTVRIANVNLIGATAQTLASDYGLYLDSTPGGTLVVRNLQVKGFKYPWRTLWSGDGHDYCNVPGVPLNGVAPADDVYVNKAWSVGAHDLVPGVDPLFVDEGAEDYRLSAASQCLGAGFDTGVARDVYGTPLAAPYPIGAYAQAAVPPKVLAAATPISSNLTLVEFDLPMLEDAAFTSPTSYSGGVLTPVGSGAAAAVTSVLPQYTGPDLLGALLLHEETTGGADYTCTVSGVQSALGAPVDPGADTAAWVGLGTLPTVVSCMQDAEDAVLVTYSEPMGDVGSPADYRITWDVPGADVTILAVTQPSPDSARLQVSPSLFPGINYTVYVVGSSVVDVAENPVDPGASSATFLSSGPCARLRGHYMTRASAVQLSTVSARTAFADSGELLVEVPSPFPPAGDVDVTNPDGQTGTLTDGWPPP